MIDRKHIGHVFAPRSAIIESGRLRFFANVISQETIKHPAGTTSGESGSSAPPLPPTFLFCLEMDTGITTGALDMMGIDIARILHGEQSFTYHAPAFAGDIVTFHSRITDIYEKKGGALEFYVMTSEVRNQHDILVAELSHVIAVRN